MLKYTFNTKQVKFLGYIITLTGIVIDLIRGLGIGFGWGASNFGQATMAYARYMRIEADGHSFNLSNSGRKASNIKQFQERVQAANSAGYELMYGAPFPIP